MTWCDKRKNTCHDGKLVPLVDRIARRDERNSSQVNDVDNSHDLK